ncbi:hypothetical protein WA588_001954, partial [Blastocystis sp. NMH]
MAFAENTNVFTIANVAVFGFVFVEILIQACLSLSSQQKRKSDYCQFLFYCLWWTLLRGGLSVPAVYKNERIFQTLLDIMYPAIVCSFLLLLKHYAKVLQERKVEGRIYRSGYWAAIVAVEWCLFGLIAGLEWTSLQGRTGIRVLKWIGMLLPFVLGVVQFGIVVWFHLSVSDSNSCASFACELVLNCLILIHFTIDVLSLAHVVLLSFLPTTLRDLVFVVVCEVIPIQLLLLLVYNFDIKTFVQPGFLSVPQEVISEFMDPSILISNPLLDYAYNKQDVENMVIATTRSHKDSETFASAEEALTLRMSGDIPYASDRNLSP